MSYDPVNDLIRRQTEAQRRDTTKKNAISNLNNGFFVDGPHAAAIVFDKRDIEPMISVLCARTGDLAEDYTATDLSDPFGDRRKM